MHAIQATNKIRSTPPLLFISVTQHTLLPPPPPPLLLLLCYSPASQPKAL
jgi:hypothetical protein